MAPKVATWLETVRQLDSCLSHRFGYFLGYLKSQVRLCSCVLVSWKFYKPVTHPPPPHPSPLYGGICDIDCAHLKILYNGGQFNNEELVY